MLLYRALLHLYPASFRAEYGEDLCALFARRRGEAGNPLAIVALWLEAFADVVTSAIPVQLDILHADLSWAFRSLRRSPAFALTAIVVAALGIGATTAAFTLTDYVLFRPLPFAGPDRLVKIWEDHYTRGYGRTEPSPANYRDWKRLATSFEGMAAYTNIALNLAGSGEPQRLTGAAVTSELFPMLSVGPAIGRTITAADDRPNAAPVILLSDALWRSQFGADPSIVGRTVVLDQTPHTVIGVMPRDFLFPARTTQFWTAIRFTADSFTDRSDTYLNVVARLRPGVTAESARAEMRLVAARLERAWPKDNHAVRANLNLLRDEIPGRSRMLLIALLAAAACVLLIGCTNLANLLLARALSRRRELAVRAAIGAGRERLIRQLLTESLLVAFAGGSAGVLVALAALPLLARLVPNALPIAEVPVIDARVLAFAALLTLVTGVTFGVLPAWRACGGVNLDGLREGSRGGVGGRRERLRAALVVAEVAGSVVLLVSCGLLVRALLRIQNVDPGFRAEGVLTLRTALPIPKYRKVADRDRFYTHVLTETRRVPGVTGAAFVSFLPMLPVGGIWPVAVPGHEAESQGRSMMLRYATPGYFSAMGIPLLAGRDIDSSDTHGSLYTAVVSESFARRFWPRENPLGRHFRFALADRTIVGVVGDVRARGPEVESEPQIYIPFRQVDDGNIIGYTPKDLVVRIATPPHTILPALRRIIAAADPEQPVSDVRMLTDVVEGQSAPRVIQVRVLGAFAAIAFLLAAIGIHGLLSFTVSTRSQEIGVRLALGAQRTTILGMILRDGARLAALGAVLGGVAALLAGGAMRALLAGLDPADPATFGAAIVLCLLMTLLGALLPALRATRVDPAGVIRVE